MRIDGTYGMGVAAEISKVPEKTLYRYRWQGLLLTAYDYLVNRKMAERIFAADAADARAGRTGGGVRGVLPEARFDLEDITRLMVVGNLGNLGWDRLKLMEALCRPLCLPLETRGDDHTPKDDRVMPRWLVVFPRVPVTPDYRLDRMAVNTLKEVAFLLSENPTAAVINLGVYREAAQRSLADVDLAREKLQKKRAAQESAKVLETV